MGQAERRQRRLGEGWQAVGRNDFRRAEELASSALGKNPRDADFLRLLGTTLLLQGRFHEALAPLQSASRVAGRKGDGYHLGQCHLSLGNAEDARSILEREVKAFPEFAEAHNLLGVALAELSRYEEASSVFEAAIRANPRFAEAHNNLGNALLKLDRSEEAVASFVKATEFQGGFVPAHDGLGIAYRRLNRLDEAIACHRRAISLAPDYADAHTHLGYDFQDANRLDEAIDCYRKAISLKPDSAEAHAGLGDAYHESGQFEAAISCRQKAISLKPDFTRAHLALGLTYQELTRLGEAAASYGKALVLEPDSSEARYHLGTVLRDQGRREEALECFEKALFLNPEYAEARWQFAMTHIPLVCAVADDPAQCRNAFARELDKLDLWADPTRIAKCFEAVGAQTPFYLAYQEDNNRELLGRHGTLCSRVMADWQARRLPVRSVTTRSGDAIRVGVVSRHFCGHSVWHAIVKGWFEQLDRKRFSLHAFHLGSAEDQETLFAKAHAAGFDHGGRPCRQWAEAIIGQQLDVLIYPEIGMDAMTVKLASLRLAPVQVAAWGHPETTGLPTIDYYLSAEDFEPANAHDNYTERLVALPGLGCYYKSPQVVATRCDLASLGIDAESPLLLCPGVPFKYAPRHDGIFPEIARRLGRCRFVFFTYQTPELSEKLRQRLETVFARNRMNMSEFVSFIPWQEWAAFYGLLERADVVLDTIGFSGFNTAMQAVECGAPMVTREGRFMRGRFAGGILKRLGLEELVAESEEEYVALAVRLVQVGAYRKQVRERIEANRHMLFEDAAPIRALEDFLVAASKRH